MNLSRSYEDTPPRYSNSIGPSGVKLPTYRWYLERINDADTWCAVLVQYSVGFQETSEYNEQITCLLDRPLRKGLLRMVNLPVKSDGPIRHLSQLN